MRFFGRFGQRERSLFSFLLSSEPFGVQAFADRIAEPSAWYRLSDFYDYVRAVFGHRLAGESHRSSWLRLLGTIDSATRLTALEERVLKTTAILNLVDAEDLVPTDTFLRVATGDADVEDQVTVAIANLLRRAVLFNRSATAGYRLWANTSVNLDAAFRSALRTLGDLEAVAPHLGRYLDKGTVLARRHYLTTGTLRYFEMRFEAVSNLDSIQQRPPAADGLVLVALADTHAERAVARAWAVGATANAPDVVVAVPAPYAPLIANEPSQP